ncbi:MAG: hypothetical protein P8165_04725 [Deltaproteobacteria bacterium]|jgi:hypothetical protein
MTTNITPPDDAHMIRCPRLGHMISFSYCRKENGGLPCFKTLDCWFEQFPVEAFMREELTEAQWAEAFKRSSKTKLSSLMELIEQAKERVKEDPS